ncbi:hypothetical protein Taro_043999 [Colocasia esculenta]|uniref:Uncharacterized protein n=1 Tax=Colocasia esculenta TaxID=4460 RepID=A0A843WTG0_COLES|nr:hypothetical protein [Colocasia esculenta]
MSSAIHWPPRPHKNDPNGRNVTVLAIKQLPWMGRHEFGLPCMHVVKRRPAAAGCVSVLEGDCTIG